MRKSRDAYPAYARSERIADGTLHAIGLVLAVIGAVWLGVWGMGHASPGQTAALIVYGVALVGTFAASAFYHMTPWEGLRPTLRRFDHAAIYLKIAGTYTPLVVMLGSGFAYTLLAVIWTIATFGMVKNLFFWRTPGKLGSVLYLIMGWMSVALIWQIWPLLPVATLALIVAGGLLYTVGVIFFTWESLKFSNPIWHGFVLAASVCFFAAIAIGASAQMV